MRINREKMAEITGCKLARGQTAWFRNYLGTEVPCDRQGPIVTEAAYEALVARAGGLYSRRETQAEEPSRPTVQLLARRK